MSELPEITDEDRAVAEEARRLYYAQPTVRAPTMTEISAALVRTGWRPVDPDLILAREVVADIWPNARESYKSGLYDSTMAIMAALAAIKAADARRRGDG